VVHDRREIVPRSIAVPIISQMKLAGADRTSGAVQKTPSLVG
jgi:hypothetical protein